MKFLEKLNKYESIISFLVIVLCMSPVFRYGQFLGMDTAAHQHNAVLLGEMITDSNSPLHEYYEFNPIPIPNLTGSIALSGLMMFLGPADAVKVMVFLYGIFMFYAFRLLLRTIKPGSQKWAWAILPAIWSTFVHYGFFSFVIAIPFAFISLHLLIRFLTTDRIKYLLFLFLALIGVWFSHISIFFVLVIISFVLFIKFNYRFLSSSIKLFIFNSIKVAIVFLPFILLSFYYFSVIKATEYTYFDLATLINMFVKGAGLGAFGDAELIYLFPILVLILTSLIVAFEYALIKKLESNVNLIFGLIIFTSTILLFIFLPDADGKGGLMSIRLLLVVYITGIVFMSVLVTHLRTVKIIVSIGVLFFAFKLAKQKQKAVNELFMYGKQINKLGEEIEPYSTVLVMQCQDSWMMGHFGNFIGVHKPIIVFENYECNTGYFPLVWKTKEIGLVQFEVNARRRTIVESCTAHKVKFPNYVLFYGESPQKRLDAKEFNVELDSLYIPFKKDGFYDLYKLR